MIRTYHLGVKVLLAAMLLALPFVSATARAEEKKQKTELNHKMESIDEGMKKLKRTLKKADQNEASIKLIDDIIKLSKECRELTPAKGAKMSDDDRKKMVDAYQKSMDKLIETMGQMKDAVAAGDNKKAQELHKALKNQEEDGHDQFIESDDKDASKSKKAE